MMEPVVLALAAAVPVVVGAWRTSPTGRGVTWGAAILLGAALASMLAGTGGLERDAWRSYALAVPGGRTFIAAGVGAMLAAAVGATAPGLWRLAAVPFIALVVTGLRDVLLSPALLVGAAVVVALLAFGAGVGRTRSVPAGHASVPWPTRDRVLLAVTVLLLVAGGPIALALPALVAVTWLAHAARRTTAWWGVPAVVTLIAAVTLWLLLTVAGTPWVTLGAARMDVPLSAAAERLVGNLWVALVLLTAGSWPLARQGLGPRTAPAGIALAWAGATMVTPDGVNAWMPLATLLLVPAALVAAARRDLGGMAGALAALAALDGSALGVASALLLVAWPVACGWGAGNPDCRDRVTLHVARVGGAVLALGLALAPTAILPREVVLGTVLAAGLGLLLPAWGGATASR